MISVIIPAYNREKYIESAVASVLDQKDCNIEFEVIVVDDGSTDRSADILSKFGDRIVYKRIPNSGRPAVPRNIGIGLAKGDLIAFQDSDDLWTDDKFKSQITAFEDPSIALVYGNAEIMDENGTKSGKTIITSDQGLSGSVFVKLLEDNVISTLTVMVRKSVIIEAGGFSESMSLRAVEDYDLWLKIASRHKLHYLDKTLAYYRKHDENISKNNSVGSLRLLLSVCRSQLLAKLPRQQKRSVLSRMSALYEQISDRSERVDKIKTQLLSLGLKTLSKIA